MISPSDDGSGRYRPPVRTNRLPRLAAVLDTLLVHVVTVFAHRIKWTAPEFHRVTVVTLSMVTNGCRRGYAALLALPTYRMRAELFRPDSLPARGAVPFAPRLRGLAPSVMIAIGFPLSL
jgi:hypothetical protein